MIDRFSVFGWAAEQTRPETSFHGIIEYLAKLLDGWSFAGIMLLIVILAIMIPHEAVMQFVAGVLCTAVTWLHFDAANWRGTFPTNPAEAFVDIVLGLMIPLGFFYLARRSWRPRKK